jgi:hypothetical protein
MLVRSGILARAGAASPNPPTLSAAFGVGSYPGDGGGTLRIDWSVTDGVGGEYINVDYTIISGNPTTSTGSASAGPASASPFDISRPLGVNARASATIKLYSASDVLLDTVNLGSTFLPT